MMNEHKKRGKLQNSECALNQQGRVQSESIKWMVGCLSFQDSNHKLKNIDDRKPIGENTEGTPMGIGRQDNGSWTNEQV